MSQLFLKSHASHLYISGHHCDKEKCPPTGKKHMFASQRSNAEFVSASVHDWLVSLLEEVSTSQKRSICKKCLKVPGSVSQRSIYAVFYM